MQMVVKVEWTYSEVELTIHGATAIWQRTEGSTGGASTGAAAATDLLAIVRVSTISRAWIPCDQDNI